MENTDWIQRRKYISISILMLILGLLFLFYLGNTLYHTEKRLQNQSISSVINSIADDF